jgi:co-chaperonin GroES (HSP10)
MQVLKPLRNLVHVERVPKPEKTEGGVVLVHGYESRKDPAAKVRATPDHFEARVLAVGPQVRGLAPGDHILVYSFDQVSHEHGLYTGHPTGEKDRMLIRFPEDIVYVVGVDPSERPTEPELTAGEPA